MSRAFPRRLFAALLAAILIAAAPAGEFVAQAQELGPETNLPLPRFVSLKSNRVNVRVGPGQDYPVAWTYVRFGLPVEITQEYDNWRRIRDSEGNEGWVLWNLLSGDRWAIVLPSDDGAPLAVHSSASETSTTVAMLEADVIAPVVRCQGGWCRLSDSRFDGWVEQDRLWGVYPDEEFD